MKRLAGVFLFASITLSLAFAASVPPSSQLRTNDYSWHLESSPRGPVLVVISLPEQQAYVYRNGVLIEAVLQSELHGQASASRSQPYYLDVTRPEANKGSVVEFLSKRLYIAPANFVTLSNQEDGFAYAMDKFVLPTATSVSAP